MNDKCQRCALLKDCDEVSDYVTSSIYAYDCSYFSPIIEEYHLKGFKVLIYEINPENNEDDDGYDPFI